MSNTARIEAERTLPTAQWVARLVEAEYGLPIADDGCRLLCRGVNDQFAIETADRRRFAGRLYRPGLDGSTIATEHAFIDHLSERGVVVSRAIASRNDMKAVPCNAPEGTRFFSLFEWAPGREQEPSHARAYGSALAALHDAADSFPPERLEPIDFHAAIDEGAAYLRTFLDDDDDIERLRKATVTAHKALAYVEERSPFLPCHGDAHAMNANVDSDGRPMFFDFDLCGNAPRPYDLATFRWSNEMRGIHSEKSWKEFIAGYRAKRPLSSSELKAATLLVPARQFWYLQFLSRNEGHWVGMSGYLTGNRATKELDRLEKWTAKATHVLRGGIGFGLGLRHRS